MNDEFNRMNQTQASKAGQPVSSMADFDEETFRSHLDGLDISDEQASELMRIVWDIMRMWVEMDFLADSCGQIVESLINPIRDESDSLD